MFIYDLKKKKLLKYWLFNNI